MIRRNDGRRISLVTGAQQGIGRAIALRLAADGAAVVVNDLRETPALTSLSQRIDGLAVAADVANDHQVRSMIDWVEELSEPVTTLVCNAAVERLGTLTDQSPEDWWSHIDVNLTGTLSLIRAVLPGMRATGHGRIILISSLWGITGFPRTSGYSASKAGLISLTKALSAEVAGRGIQVNAIAPGIIDAPQIELDAADAGISLDEMRARYAAGIPMRRLGTSDEIAATVAFLASPAGAHFNGQILQPNGGTPRGPA